MANERVVSMKKKSTSSEIYDYILNNYSLDEPILIKEVSEIFPTINTNTIRSIFSRLKDNGLVVMIDSGIYALLNNNSVLSKPKVYTSDIIKKKYIGDDMNTIGYRTGINFANQLGLTTQTASVDFIVSNAVSKKRREIKIKNNRLIVDAPRVEVNSDNFKLLQILDLLNEFSSLSEVDLKTAKTRILEYLSKIELDESELEKIVSSYPLRAQVNFYKIGGQNAIASK